jgi:hypothetical protein
MELSPSLLWQMRERERERERERVCVYAKLDGGCRGGGMGREGSPENDVKDEGEFGCIHETAEGDAGRPFHL